VVRVACSVVRDWMWVFAAAVVVLAGCATRSTEVMEVEGLPTAEALPTVPALAAGRTVLADGRLESPYPPLALGFGGGVSGHVLTITVRPGDVVQAGDLLALLDDTDLRQAVDDARLALDRATVDRDLAQAQWERDVANAEEALAAAQRALTTAQLQVSTTAVEEARTALERARQAEANALQQYNDAYNRRWEPQEIISAYYDGWQRAVRERELAELRLADAEDAASVGYLQAQGPAADVARAQRARDALQAGLAPAYDRAVEDAQRRLADAEEALTHARLAAPWAAIVLSVDVAPAATVGAGTPVVTLLDIQDGLRFVTQNLSEQHVAAIRPGQRAVVTLRAFPDTPLEGTVEAVVPLTGQAAPTDARFAVHMRLAAGDLPLLPGLTGRVEIFIEH